jgi:hypothetical protein
VLAIGILVLVSSIIYSSNVLVFVGLGLVFWGFILFYVQTDKYVKKSLFDATSCSEIANFSKLICELGFHGKWVFLPPKYLNVGEVSKVYVSEAGNGFLPSAEEIKKEGGRSFVSNPKAVLFVSPGSELAELFEKKLKVDFLKVDLKYIQDKLPVVFVEDLEIAKDFEMDVEKGTVLVKLKQPSLSVGSCLSAAIACALAKITSVPVIIEQEKINDAKDDMLIEYRLIGEGAQV